MSLELDSEISDLEFELNDTDWETIRFIKNRLYSDSWEGKLGYLGFLQGLKESYLDNSHVNYLITHYHIAMYDK